MKVINIDYEDRFVNGYINKIQQVLMLYLLYPPCKVFPEEYCDEHNQNLLKGHTALVPFKHSTMSPTTLITD